MILGKNNAGKSNVIKAIDLVLGGSSPDYSKSENITKNDFHKRDIDEPILIFCELTRDDGEELNYDAIQKCSGFQFINEAVIHEDNFAFKDCEKSDTLSDYRRYFAHLARETADEDVFRQAEWISPLRITRRQLVDHFDDIYSFGIFFSAYCSDGVVRKNARLMFRQDTGMPWKIANRAAIRNELLTSAIIPSFRDPNSQLRLNQWSWYGKLIRNCFDPDDQNLKDAFDNVKETSNNLFAGLSERFNREAFQRAFPDTKVSFQFNPDTDIDVYKSTLIYVDDGFNSLLETKGSGIQSTVIIELFNYYTHEFAHASGSLLAVEEPELYLHPQARRVLSNQLDEFLDNGKNQVIVTTHSSEFISSASERLSVHVIRKDADKRSQAKKIVFDDTKDKQILLRRHNAEMFFADRVILVEGGDKYIVEGLAEEFANTPDGTALNLSRTWLDSQNFSVVATGGKSEFIKYFRKLKALDIKCVLLTDFDFFKEGLTEFFTKVGPNAKDFKDELDWIKGQLGSLGKVKRITDISEEHHRAIRDYLAKLRGKGIFLLEGELEDLFTAKCLGMKKEAHRGFGKEEFPIYIVSDLVTAGCPLSTLVEAEPIYTMFKHLHRE